MPKKTMVKPKVFGTFMLNETTQLRVSTQTNPKTGRRSASVRKFWLPEGGDSFLPTKIGVEIYREHATEVLAAVIDAVQDLMAIQEPEPLSKVAKAPII
jgi:hypothetical protein